jgi:hypothetical protein
LQLHAATLPLHHADPALATCGGGHIDLSVAIVRIAPASAFEQTVCGGDPTEGKASRQIATRINYASPQLAHVQGLSTRMLAGRRATAGPNTAHE